jgi:HSP20 family molecular chaperone IbpA
MTATSLVLQDAAAVLDELFGAPSLRDPIRPLLVLEEHHDRFEMRARLPRLSADELEVVVAHRHLDLAAIHRESPRLRWCMAQRGPELAFARRYALSESIVPHRVTASLREGVLLLRLPKAAATDAAPPRPVRVSVSE